jgi:hypothetical protein
MLHRLLHAIVETGPGHGPMCRAKVNLLDAYMLIRLHLDDLPKPAFFVPPHPSNPEPIIDLHLSLPMGFVESAPYFCASTKTTANLINHSWGLATSPPPAAQTVHMCDIFVIVDFQSSVIEGCAECFQDKHVVFVVRFSLLCDFCK